MSHELRNAAQCDSRIFRGDEERIFGAHAIPVYKEYSGDIHNSGVLPAQSHHEILDLSRIEAGRYELNEEAVTTGHGRRRLHHLLKLARLERRPSPLRGIRARHPRIWADERATRQIVLNLLSNSIKFTRRAGRSG